ncbi:MAG: YqgE/AlgH family protein [Bacteroidetes bacterium]|nr:YqgE/AlgH family protein [Bacteroidota bacterium]
MITPSKGTLLIANPFLKDPNFIRSVIFICEHTERGSFGFVLNKAHTQPLNELLPDIELSFPVFIGGPVQTDSLHFLHQYPDLIPGGEEVSEGIYWGGNFESLRIHLNSGNIEQGKIRFFIGYSGWTEGQLDEELKTNSWLTVTGNRKIIFNTTAENIWKDSLKLLGGDYEMMINYPLDPQLN